MSGVRETKWASTREMVTPEHRGHGGVRHQFYAPRERGHMPVYALCAKESLNCS